MNDHLYQIIGKQTVELINTRADGRTMRTQLAAAARIAVRGCVPGGTVDATELYEIVTGKKWRTP